MNKKRKINLNHIIIPNSLNNKQDPIHPKKSLLNSNSYNGNAIILAQAEVTTLRREILGSESTRSRIVKENPRNFNRFITRLHVANKERFIHSKKNNTTTG